MKVDKTVGLSTAEDISNGKVAEEGISDLCRQIVAACHPQKIILFGSYAYGTPTDDSDVDLLVVMPFEGHPAYQAGGLRSQLHTQMAVDLLVRTPEQIEERIAMGDPFIQEIVEQGKILYEADHNGMDRQGRARLGRRAA
jgi:predicted nucleotidyltransferase